MFEIQFPSSKGVAEKIVDSSSYAASGALGAYIFTSIHPIAGALFGTSYYFASVIIEKGLDKILRNDSIIQLIIKYATRFFSSLFIAVSVLNLAGYSMTLLSGVGCSFAMLPASLVTALALYILKISTDVLVDDVEWTIS